MTTLDCLNSSEDVAFHRGTTICSAFPITGSAELQKRFIAHSFQGSVTVHLKRFYRDDFTALSPSAAYRSPRPTVFRPYLDTKTTLAGFTK